MRPVVEQAIAELSTFRGWDLFALNVRSNHVHTVVAAAQPPENVMKDLKARATIALRSAGLLEPSRPIWAAGGSTRRAWDEKRLAAYIRYTLRGQGPHLPGAEWAQREWKAGEL